MASVINFSRTAPRPVKRAATRDLLAAPAPTAPRHGLFVGVSLICIGLAALAASVAACLL